MNILPPDLCRRLQDPSTSVAALTETVQKIASVTKTPFLPPQYVYTSAGADHTPTFQCRLSVSQPPGGTLAVTATGATKKEAGRNAAVVMGQKLVARDKGIDVRDDDPADVGQQLRALTARIAALEAAVDALSSK